MLTPASSNANGTVSYTYDNVGNRTAMTSTLAAVPSGTFSYDNNDRLAIDSYDANGNTVSSAGISYVYDFENRLTLRGAVAITYDGDGNRVAETVGGATTKYLVDTLNPTGYAQVMDELASGAVTRTYTYGLQHISENQKIGATQTASFYGYDGHGNVRFLSGTAGTVTDTYVYDAFGLPLTTTGTTPNNFLYSGEQFDSVLGMYYLRARYYNPATGRFVTMDPAGGLISSPETLQKYVYARDNPVNRFDPAGRADFLENFAFRVWYLTQIVVPAYIAESYIGQAGAVKVIGAAGGLAGLAAVTYCAFLEANEELKSFSEPDSGPEVRAPEPSCNEQPHPAPGGIGEGGEPGIPNAPGGGGAVE